MKVATLTPSENIIAMRLNRVKDCGIYGEMIRSVCSKNKPVEFRQLLRDIKSQALDAPGEVMKMIGLKTYLMIINL